MTQYLPKRNRGGHAPVEGRNNRRSRMAKNDNRNDRDDDADEIFPKYIAGVKVPKALRDQGRAAAQLAQSPLARELLTAGLAAAAAAVVANDKSRKKIKDAGQGAVDAAGDVAAGAGRIGAAITAAATDAVQRLFGLGQTEEEDDEPAPRRRAAPKRKTAARSTRSSGSGEDGRTTRRTSGTRATSTRGTRGRSAQSGTEGEGETPKRRAPAKRGAGATATRRGSGRTAGEGRTPRRRNAAQNESGQQGGEGGNGGENGNAGNDNGGGEG